MGVAGGRDSMRAQISLEYLIIALTAVAILSVSLLALAKIRASADASYETIRFNALKDNLFNAVDEVCALGNGNSKTISFPFQARISSRGGSAPFFLSVYAAGHSASHETKCDISINGDFKEEMHLINDGGLIKEE